MFSWANTCEWVLDRRMLAAERKMKEKNDRKVNSKLFLDNTYNIKKNLSEEDKDMIVNEISLVIKKINSNER